MEHKYNLGQEVRYKSGVFVVKKVVLDSMYSQPQYTIWGDYREEVGGHEAHYVAEEELEACPTIPQ